MGDLSTNLLPSVSPDRKIASSCTLPTTPQGQLCQIAWLIRNPIFYGLRIIYETSYPLRRAMKVRFLNLGEVCSGKWHTS